jgi:hypothetical protein
VTTESGQASGQSSSSSSGQQQSQGSAAQGGASDQGQQTQNSGQQQQQAPQRPAYVPEKFWNGEKGEVIADQFTQHFNDLSARDAERVAREQAIPVSPDKYEIKLPEGFKPPEGMQFEFNADDPALAEARKAAHELKLDQAGFSRMLGIYAANKLAEVQAVSKGRETEMAKLGASGPQRIEAIETWLNAKVGDKAKVLVSTLKQYPVAANVEALESVMRLFSSQGGSSVTQSGREHETDQGKIPGYENMTFTQRRAAQMNQKFAG